MIQEVHFCGYPNMYYVGKKNGLREFSSDRSKAFLFSTEKRMKIAFNYIQDNFIHDDIYWDYSNHIERDNYVIFASTIKKNIN